MIFKGMYHSRFELPITISFCMLFTIVMFAWWMYMLEWAMPTIANLIEVVFRLEGAGWTPIPVGIQYLQEHKAQYMLVPLGFNLLCAIGEVGILSMLATGLRDKHRFALAASGAALTIIVGLFGVLGLTGFHLPRWYPFVEWLMAIPAAVAILLITGLFKSNLIKGLVIVCLIFALVFISITTNFANQDSPIYLRDITARSSYIQSEVNAASTILEKYQGMIRTDFYYTLYFNCSSRFWDVGKLPAQDLTEKLISGNFQDIENLVVIRREIIGKPFDVSGGKYKLNYDPIDELGQLHFNRIYDSKAVSAFIR